MFYVYILLEKNGQLYTGFSADLKLRIKEHNSGSGGHYTCINRPFRLIYYEAYIDKSDAAAAELFYKSGYGREILKGKLKNYFSKIK